MARLRGRSPRGKRCRASVPHGHWKTTTLIAGLRLDGLTAPMVVDGAMDGEMFTAYAEKILAPTLSEGDIVILDNLPAHKVSGARETIEATGASIRPQEHQCSSSRHIARTSIRSNRHFQDHVDPAKGCGPNRQRIASSHRSGT